MGYVELQEMPSYKSKYSTPFNILNKFVSNNLAWILIKIT